MAQNEKALKSALSMVLMAILFSSLFGLVACAQKKEPPPMDEGTYEVPPTPPKPAKPTGPSDDAAGGGNGGSAIGDARGAGGGSSGGGNGGAADGGAVSAGHITSIDEMIFPVQGPNRFSNDYGAPRSGGRKHTGNDILADKMIPVLAVADGIVVWTHDVASGRCCDMAIDHEGGWQSRYIHLNNDTPGTDDGKGNGLAPGIEPWAEVKAGQLIGWVGDSGNAEATVSHLHFEILVNDEFINPYEALLKAKASAPFLLRSAIQSSHH